MKLNWMTGGLILIIIGAFLYFDCMVPASPLQLLAYLGLIIEIIGIVFCLQEAAKRRKSQKNEDDETKKW